MRFIKKAAALFFCLALALSVMAISAAAVDGDGGYSITLTPSNTNIKNHDNNGKYEIVPNDTELVTYDIMLKGTREASVNAFYFTVSDVSTGLTVNETTNEGVTDLGVTIIGKDNADHAVKEGSSSYAFYPNQGGTQDIQTTTNTNGVKVGTIAFKVGAVAGSPTFKLTNIHLSERTTTANSSSVSVDYALADVSQSDLEVKEATYIITLTPKKNATTTNVIEADATVDVTYDFLTGMLTYPVTEGTATATAVADMEPAAVLNAYDFDKWSVTGNNSGGWATTYLDEAAIAPRNFGNVAMEANYNIVTYTITYDFTKTTGDSDTENYTSYVMTLGENNLPTTTAYATVTTYKVTDISTTATVTSYLHLATMARKGYTLKGWTATQTANSNVTVGTGGDATTRTAKTNEYNGWSSLSATSTSTDVLVGAYGNVTLTPKWEFIGKKARTSYQYAYTGEELVLFAVPTNSVAGTYTCKIGETAYTLYQVTNTKYAAAFTGSGNNDSLDAEASTYTVFASIIPQGADMPTFAVTEGNDTNGVISYTGKVFGSGSLNASDYGNANTMLGNVGIFNNTAVSIEERLKVDRYDATGDNTETIYGSILDVKAIIDQVFAS